MDCKILGYSYKIAVPETIKNSMFFDGLDNIFSSGGYVIDSIGKWDGGTENVRLYCKSYSSKVNMFWELLDILDLFVCHTQEASIYIELSGKRSTALIIPCEQSLEFEDFLSQVFEIL